MNCVMKVYYGDMWRESGMIAVARDKVYRGRSYRQLDCCSSMDIYLGAGHIYTYMYILDYCSSMDNLGAGLLSTWIRETFFENKLA